jgi:chromosome condensin MukBEF MukE localization factor
VVTEDHIATNDLAFAAIDSSFQAQVSHLYDILHTELRDTPHEALAARNRAADGHKLARDVRSAMQQLVRDYKP